MGRSRPDYLLMAAVVAVIAAMVHAIWFTPLEAAQGIAQKIFYVHVPSAIVALYLGFALLAITSGLYLWLRRRKTSSAVAPATARAARPAVTT